jgi:hypothetical protein
VRLPVISAIRNPATNMVRRKPATLLVWRRRLPWLPWLVTCYGTAGRTLQKSCCFGGFEDLVTWQRPRPFARDLRKSHKKAGFSVVLENNPSWVFNQLSFCTLYTVYALLFTLLIYCFAVKSRFALWCTLCGFLSCYSFPPIMCGSPRGLSIRGSCDSFSTRVRTSLLLSSLYSFSPL